MIPRSWLPWQSSKLDGIRHDFLTIQVEEVKPRMYSKCHLCHKLPEGQRLAVQKWREDGRGIYYSFHLCAACGTKYLASVESDLRRTCRDVKAMASRLRREPQDGRKLELEED